MTIKFGTNRIVIVGRQFVYKFPIGIRGILANRMEFRLAKNQPLVAKTQKYWWGLKQIDQANADKNIAQAKAEERRAMAVATEQEMKAKAEEARANVIQAEAEVPKAMAEAFRSGNLGIMDYYKMKNIQADTSMRENIAKPIGGATSKPLSD